MDCGSKVTDVSASMADGQFSVANKTQTNASLINKYVLIVSILSNRILYLLLRLSFLVQTMVRCYCNRVVSYYVDQLPC